MSAVPQMAPIAQFSRSESRLGAGMRNAELRGEVLQPGGQRRVWRGGGGGGGEAARARGGGPAMRERNCKVGATSRFLFTLRNGPKILL